MMHKPKFQGGQNVVILHSPEGTGQKWPFGVADAMINTTGRKAKIVSCSGYDSEYQDYTYRVQIDRGPAYRWVEKHLGQ